ncbi:hypothetical protein [Pandoraea norimbergensis]|uniref:Uncharacterized protein n=1 Tax=Pandoraea norimbergensis TaxID=93219 RepID=A0ABM5WML0_9BURK|nr:hypothetical protein [Pandoraea norimbergensis]ALS61849.1 hypothetical protein AT302_20775 [Pandoraea norimbergensis]
MALSDDMKFKLAVAGIAVAAVVYVGRRATTAATSALNNFTSGAFNYVQDARATGVQTYDSLGLTQVNNWLGGLLDPLGMFDPNGNAFDHWVALPHQVSSAANAYGQTAAKGLPPDGAAWFGGT